MPQPTLIIMCGLPFSGKTVLAKKISQKRDISVVSIDEIREERGFSWEDNDRVTAADWSSIFDEAYRLLTHELDDGRSVIYDSANQDRASRDELRALALAHNARTELIYLDVPLTTIMQRWQENQKTKARFHLPKKWLQAAINTLEPPTPEENPQEPQSGNT